jgi:type I restriction enzyme M protein
MCFSSTTNLLAKNPWTKEIWVYDFRTNIHFTLKEKSAKTLKTLERLHCLLQTRQQKQTKRNIQRRHNPEGRWRKFTYDEIIATEIKQA